MMKRVSLLLAGAVALSGCVVMPAAVQPPVSRTPPVVAPPAPPPADIAARTVAREVVNREMARRLPGVNVAPYTDCVLNNATAAEVMTMGTSPNAANTVAGIVSRPATTQCIAGLARTA
ncbi:MAG: hypothetical protein P3W90_002840 [Paracoccus sp. (in: a-proteobacteria)]|nr:hypothetical protein [Paracoccus sp. (in: a-proteobacteria)]